MGKEKRKKKKNTRALFLCPGVKFNGYYSLVKEPLKLISLGLQSWRDTPNKSSRLCWLFRDTVAPRHESSGSPLRSCVLPEVTKPSSKLIVGQCPTPASLSFEPTLP